MHRHTTAARAGSAGAAMEPPLIVDLDGTLLRTDLLFEGIATVLRTRPWLLLLLPVWLLLEGKAGVKRRIALAGDVDIATLPVNQRMLDWVAAERGRGRRVAIVSAADQLLVDRVAERYGPFDAAIGSDGATNLSGIRKVAAIEARFGAGFTYCGDAPADLHIWEHCRSAILVGRGTRLLGRLSPQVAVLERFEDQPVGWRVWARALRVHQWAKNGLVFVPLLLAGATADTGSVLRAAMAALALSLTAAATYLVNDLLDLAADRRHRSKRHRPFAAGDLPLADGLVAVPLLAFCVAALLPPLPTTFALTLGAYLVTTLAYSFRLKRVAILDLFVLAFLFTLRLVAGIVAIGAVLSPWLLTFSMFFFLSLAAMKRYTECRMLGGEGSQAAPGRGYWAGDHPWLLAMGAASGFCSALVFFLYLVEPDSPAQAYAHPELLWVICAILGYWLSAAWLVACRGEMNDDPVLFAVRDRQSRMLGAVTALLVVVAQIPWTLLT